MFLVRWVNYAKNGRRQPSLKKRKKNEKEKSGARKRIRDQSWRVRVRRTKKTVFKRFKPRFTNYETNFNYVTQILMPCVQDEGRLS